MLVTGHVQGVFFRDTCQTEAASVGLAGWVRNLPDLRVEAVFEGEARSVTRLVNWCAVGPPGADVRGVESFDEEPTGLTGFEIEW